LLRRASGTARPFVRWRIFLWRIPIFTGEFYLQAAEGIPFATPEIISGDAVLPAAARAESPAKPDFARISAAAARRRKVPLKNRGVRQFARRCRRNVRAFAEDPKRPPEIQDVSWKFKTSAEVLNRQQTIWIFSGRFHSSADVLTSSADVLERPAKHPAFCQRFGFSAYGLNRPLTFRIFS